MQQASELRRRIRKTIQKFANPTVEDVVRDLSRHEEIDEDDVLNSLDELERHGFIYTVERGDGREVRLT